MPRKRKLPRVPPPTHSVRCLACGGWFAMVWRGGAWRLPPHVVPAKRYDEATYTRPVIYVNGRRSSTSAWCENSGQAVNGAIGGRTHGPN